MIDAGSVAAEVASARYRLGAALAALALHMLALAAALMVGGQPGGERRPPARTLTVIALDQPRSEPPHRFADMRAGQAPAPRTALPPTRQASADTPVAAMAVPAPIAAPALTSEPASLRVPEALIPAVHSRKQAPDTAELERAAYAALLWQHIAAHRPRGVQLRGAAVIRFRLSASGALEEVVIARSSGDFNLDRIAMRAVRQAAPLPPPPGGLAGDQLAFTVPVEFR